MSKKDNFSDFLKDLANTIRTNEGSIDLINPQNFSDRIRDNLNAYKGIITGATTNFNSPVEEIRNYAFYKNTSLISAVFSKATKIGQYAFQGCSTIQDISLPEATGNLTGTFHGCVYLQKAYIPNISSIKAYAFYDCLALKSIVLTSEVLVTLTASSAFTGSGIAEGTGYIYVPDHLVESYKTATNWSQYASQIKGISEFVEEE